MIDRYILHANKEKLLKRYDLKEFNAYQPTFNAIPTHQLPILTNRAEGEISNLFWGQTPQWSKNKKLSTKLFNAPSEEFITKKTLKLSLENKRCLIPATGFVHWNQIGKKTAVPYLYHLEDFELFSIAGIWEEYSTINDDPEKNDTYVIFKMITIYHPEYHIETPLVLNRKHELEWVQGRVNDELKSYLSPETFNSYSISPISKNTTSDDIILIQSVPPMDQKGNYTLFG